MFCERWRFSINKKFTKAGLLYLLGNIFNKGIAFLTVPIYIRIMSTDEYGIVNTYTAAVGIISILIGMSLHMSIRTAFIDFLEEIDEFMQSIFMLVIITMLGFSLVSLVTMNLFSFNSSSIIIIFLCILQGFSTAIIEDYSMYLMMKYNYKTRTLVLIMPNFVSTLLSVLSIVLLCKVNRYMGKIIPTSLITTIIAVGIIAMFFQKKRLKTCRKYWKYALGISLPIIFHALSLNILSQSDRIMITFLKGSDETGIYSLIYNFSMIANIFIISVEGVWVPWFTKNISLNNIKKINEKAVNYIEIVSLAVVCIILVSPEVLKFVALKKYWIGIPVIPLVVSTSYIIFMYTMYVNVEHFYKETKHIALNTIIAAITNLILNFIFIPRYGMYAAAVTTLVSYIISLVLHYKFAKNINREVFPFKLFLGSLFLLGISIIVFYMFIECFIIRYIVCGTIITKSYIKNKKELAGFVKSLIKKES